MSIHGDVSLLGVLICGVAFGIGWESGRRIVMAIFGGRKE